MQEAYWGVQEGGEQDWAEGEMEPSCSPNNASVDSQSGAGVGGCSGAGVVQAEAGAKPLRPPSVTRGAQAILGGGITLGKACAQCPPPVGRGCPAPSPPARYI